MQKNCLFMTAARGSAQNEFMQASYKRSEYFRLPAHDSNQRFTMRANVLTHTQA